MKDLQQGATPIFHDIVMRGEALIDKLPEVISDRLASVPVGDTSWPSIRKAFAIPIGTTCTPLITCFAPMAELLAPFTGANAQGCLFVSSTDQLGVICGNALC
jgi:hypothetical protein